MHIIRVIPLAALPNTVSQVLDYFWVNPLPQGSLVRVLVGRRPVNALVLESLDLEQAKLAVKKSSFDLKKISAVITDQPQATTQQLSLVRWMARQYYVPLGLCAKTILPSWLGKRSHILKLQIEPPEIRNTQRATIFLTQPDTAIRAIQKIIAKTKKPILLIVPEVNLAKWLTDQLVKYNPILVHGELSTKTHAIAYQSVLAGKARIIIGTRIAMFLPFVELAHIIMEDPQHETYKSDMTPRYVSADVVRELASIYNSQLTYLSPAISTVNYYLADKNIIPIQNHKPYWPRIVEANMTIERQHNPSILSRPVQEAILDAYEQRQPILLFSPRRAYASHIDCDHCHKPIICATCAIPMRLNKYGQENMLVCYHCTSFTQVPKQCPICHNGRLKVAGLAGSQRIAEAINICLDRHGYAKLNIPILDTDLVRTAKDEEEILTQFTTMKQPILVATQKIFSHRYKMTFPQIAVIEADALVYNPDFRTQERLIYQLEKLADFKPETIYLQSWDNQGALVHALNRSWDKFYKQELNERKVLDWPPYVRIVKLTFTHRDGPIATRTARITVDRLKRTAQDLKMEKQVSVLGPTPALVERSGGRWTQHIIIKTTLPSEKLNILLAHSEPGVSIDIDPRSIT